MLFGETSSSKGLSITNLCKETYSVTYVIYISKALIYFTLHLNSLFQRIFQSCVWDFVCIHIGIYIYMSTGTHRHKERVRCPKVGAIGTASILTWVWDLNLGHLSRHHTWSFLRRVSQTTRICLDEQHWQLKDYVKCKGEMYPQFLRLLSQIFIMFVMLMLFWCSMSYELLKLVAWGL